MQNRKYCNKAEPTLKRLSVNYLINQSFHFTRMRKNVIGVSIRYENYVRTQ